MMQLDLFDWTPPKENAMGMSAMAPAGAQIIPFPQEHNIGKARHVAALLLKRRTEKDQESYWRQVCNRMAGSMAKAGLDDDQIATQLNAFSRAVSNEMYRQDNIAHGVGE